MPTLDDVRAARQRKLPSAPPPAHPDDDDALTPTPPPRLPSGDRTPVARAQLAEQEDLLNALWYGPGGTGKTTDVASMAHLGKIVLVNAESGIKRRALQRMGIPVENIELVPDPDSGQELTYELVDDLFWELKSDLESGRSAYVGTGWDSLTDIVKKLLQDVVANRVKRAKRRGETNQLIDPFFTDLADYGPMSEQVRQLIRRYRDLPIHFVATALERRDTDSDGRVLYRPAVTPALYQDLDLYMDTICHTEVHESDDPENPVFLGLFKPLGKYRGKDRFKILPSRIANPTFDRVLGYVTEEISAEDDQVQIEARQRLRVETAVAASAESDDVA